MLSEKDIAVFVNDDGTAFNWIEQVLPSYHVIRANSTSEAITQVRMLAPRILLADAGLQGLDELQETTRLESPETAIVVFARDDEDLCWAQERGMLAIPLDSIPVALSETTETVPDPK